MPAVSLTTHLSDLLGFTSPSHHSPPLHLGAKSQQLCEQHADSFLATTADYRQGLRAQRATSFLTMEKATGLTNAHEPIHTSFTGNFFTFSVKKGKRNLNELIPNERLSEPISHISSQEKERPIVMLDVDGVLNRYNSPGGERLENDLIQNLARVVKNTSANLVISSNWRKFPQGMSELKAVLRHNGIPLDRIIGQTPVLCSAWECRAMEIQKFFHTHPTLGKAGWVAVDDMDVEVQHPGYMHGHFLKTDSNVGLTAERADALEHMLRSAGGEEPLLPDFRAATL